MPQFKKLFLIVILAYVGSSADGSLDRSKVPCLLMDAAYWLFVGDHSDINYLLFTNSNPNTSCDLQPSVESLNKCGFDSNLETIVIIHGWVAYLPPDDLKFAMKDKYLEEGKYNVVVFNWTSFAQTQEFSFLGYGFSSYWSFSVGLRLAAWIKFLEVHADAEPERFHLIAHSLGAHVASYAGKSICTIGKITWLDAAGPIFGYLPSLMRTTSSDALYTEAMYTDGSGFGIMKDIANVKYYPNGGANQPKCKTGNKFLYVTNVEATVNSDDTRVSCNHNACFDYFLASFKEDCHFRGLICDSYKDFEDGKCNSSNSKECEMNFKPLKKNPKLPRHYKCFFKTSENYPYCLN